MLTRFASETLSQTLECDVQIQGISGTILTGIYCKQLDAVSMDELSPLRTLTLEDLEIKFNPLRLITGDLTALDVRASRGCVNYDCDRPGRPSNDDRDSSPFSMPTHIPRVELDLLELSVSGGGYSMQINGGALFLGVGKQADVQSGDIRARTVTFTHAQSTYSLNAVTCPLEYSSNRIRVGPVHTERDDNLLSAEFTWTRQIPLRAKLKLKAKPCGGRLVMDGWINEQGTDSFEAEIGLEEIDLAAIPFPWFLSEPVPYELQGRLSFNGEVRGNLQDAATLEAMAHATLTQGAFDRLAPLDLTLGAAFRQGELSVYEGFGKSDSSWIDITSCTIPIREDGFQVEELSAVFAFRFDRFQKGVECFALDETYSALIARSELEGEGRLGPGHLHLDPARLALDEGEFSFRSLDVAWQEDVTSINVDHVEGQYEGRRFSLVEPAQFKVSSFGLESADLTVQAEGGMVDVEGSISNDLIVDAHTEIWDVDLNLIHDLLPKEVAERMSWEGVSLQLDATGPIDDLTGNLDLRFKKFGYDMFHARDVRILAKRRQPDRLDVDEIRFTLEEGGDVRLAGSAELDPLQPISVPKQFDSKVEITDFELSKLADFDAAMQGLDGTAWIQLELQGDPAAPRGTVTANAELSGLPPRVYESVEGPFDLRGTWNVELTATQEAEGLIIEPLKLSGGAGTMTASCRLPLRFTPLAQEGLVDLDESGPFDAAVELPRLDLMLHDSTVSPVSCEAKFSGPLQYPSGEFSVHAAPLSFGLPDPMNLVIDGTLAEGWLRFEKMIMSRGKEEVVSGTAKLDLNGPAPSTLSLPNPDSKMQLDLGMLCREVSDLGVPFSGKGRSRIQGEGTLSNPRYTMTLAVDEGSFRTPDSEIRPVDSPYSELPLLFSFNGDFEGDRHGFRARRMFVETLAGTVTSSAQIPLHLDFDSITNGNVFDGQGSLEGDLSFAELDLAYLDSFLPQVRRLTGKLTGNLILGGTPTDIQVDGGLSLTEGAFRIQGQLPSMEKFDADLALTEKAITVTRLQGELGASPVGMTGTIGLKDFQPDTLDLKLVGENALLYRGSGIRLRADLDLAVKGPLDKAVVTGEVQVVDSRIVRNVSLIPEKGPPPVDEPVQPFSFVNPPFRNLLFDVGIVTRESDALVLHNNLCSGDVTLDMKLKGTGFEPYFLGTAGFDDMLLKLPNFKFNIDSGTVVFSETNPYEPYLRCVANGRRQSIDVNLLVEGPVTGPDIILTSNPPLDYDELVLLVASGVFPKGHHAAAQLGAYLGEEIYERFFATESTEAEASPFDRLELSFGTEVGADGTENFVLDYNFKGPWHIQVEEDIYKDWNAGFVYRIRFK